MADASDPAVHVALAIRREEVDPLGRADVKHVGVALLSALDREPGIHLLALVQVDLALQLPTGSVRVVLEEVLAGQLSGMLQNEPSPPPLLQMSTNK